VPATAAELHNVTTPADLVPPPSVAPPDTAQRSTPRQQS